jgi:hypothetical protein
MFYNDEANELSDMSGQGRREGGRGGLPRAPGSGSP